MRRVLLLVVLLLLSALGSATPAAAASTNSLGLSASYVVDATFNWSTRAVTVHSSANVKNTTGSAIGALAFNLATLRIGHAHVGVVNVDGHAVSVDVDDQTVFVPLSPALAPGARSIVTISYTATLSTSTVDDNAEFARTGGIMTAYRWIPWLSRPTRFDRPNVGETWVTSVSPSVRVTLHSDRRLTFATSGHRVSDNGLTQTFAASNVRDFNFSAAPDYKTSSRSVSGTRITFYYRKLSPSAVLNAAAGAFTSFSNRIGSMPYATLSIAEVMAGGDSIESPGMFYLDPGTPSTLRAWEVAHEVAHQWFYAVVGNDQANQPFADEAVADFIARDYVNRWAKSQCSTARLDQTVYQLGSCFAWVIYVQGNLYLKAYRDKVGNAAFYRGLHNYYLKYKFRIGGTRQLLDALDAASGISYPHYQRFPTLY